MVSCFPRDFCASAGLLRFARNDSGATVIASEAKQSGKANFSYFRADSYL